MALIVLVLMSSHLPGDLGHYVVQEAERGHVEQLIAQLGSADNCFQHLARHRYLSWCKPQTVKSVTVAPERKRTFFDRSEFGTNSFTMPEGQGTSHSSVQVWG